MSDAAPPASSPAGQGSGDERQQQQESPFSGVIRMVFMFLMIRYMMSGSGNASKGTDSSTVDSSSVAYTPKFSKGDLITFDFYITESNDFDARLLKTQTPVYSVPMFEYGNWIQGPNQDGKYVGDVTVDLTPTLLNNGSVYSHVFVYKHGVSPDPSDPNYDPKGVMYRHAKLNIHRKRIKVEDKENLMQGNLPYGTNSYGRREEG